MDFLNGLTLGERKWVEKRSVRDQGRKCRNALPGPF